MDITKSSVALAWTKPRDGGSAITGYYVEFKLTSSETWERHTNKIASTMYTLTGLTADAEYQFRVIAENDIGESEAGPASDVVTCKDPFGKSAILFIFTKLVKFNISNIFLINDLHVFPLDKPSQPGEIDIVAVTNNCISIRWGVPECDGGKEILGYWVEYRKSIESTWKKSNKQRSKEKEHIIRGLQEASEYEFRVFAENATGISRPRRTATGIKTKLASKFVSLDGPHSDISIFLHWERITDDIFNKWQNV